MLFHSIGHLYGTMILMQIVVRTRDSSSETVFVGHLSWNVDDDWLKSEFEECGDVIATCVQMDGNTGKSYGFAYIEIANPALQHQLRRCSDLPASKSMALNKRRAQYK